MRHACGPENPSWSRSWSCADALWLQRAEGTSLASNDTAMTIRRLLDATSTTLVLTLGTLGIGCGGHGDATRPIMPEVERADVRAPQEVADVSVEMRAPSRVRWMPTVLGPNRPTLGVVVANRGPTPLDVSNLRVHLEAVREEVSFRCAAEVGAEPSAREPSSLAAGGSFVFERALDCALPLVGSYAIRVSVAFGHGAWATRREVRSFNLRVFSTKEIEPRTIDPIPGLWGALGATTVMERRTGDSGRLVIALVNGGRVPLELPRFRLALRVTKIGTPIPCEDEPVVLRTPPILGVGESYHEPVTVSCLGLGVPGVYDVAGRLQMGGGDDGWEIELGRLRVEVSGGQPTTIPRTPSLFR